MTVFENLQMGAAVNGNFENFDEDLEKMLTLLFPRIRERLQSARRHALGRRAADGRDRRAR